MPMFKAIGTILLLYAVSNIFAETFVAFEGAATATFEAVEVAADVSKEQLRAQAR